MKELTKLRKELKKHLGLKEQIKTGKVKLNRELTVYLNKLIKLTKENIKYWEDLEPIKK